MTITGTTAFTYNRDQIIQFAMRKLGILELGATPDPLLVQNFSDSLNLLLKSWINKGMKIWTVTDLVIPLTAGTATYQIGPASSSPNVIADKPIKLIQAWLRNTSVTPNNDIPMSLLSLHNYEELGSKFSTGTPNSVYMFVNINTSFVSTYPVADATVAATYQLHILTQRLLYDVNVGTDNLDLPAEWLYATGWNLALDQMLDVGCPPERQQVIMAAASKFLTEAEDFDVEYTSTFFTPDQRSQRR